MNKKIEIRQATTIDCSHLVVLSDIATRNLTSFLWGSTATDGQSAMEIGRELIRTDKDQFLHYSNWQIAEINGYIMGGFNSYALPFKSKNSSTKVNNALVLQPLNELKLIAEGTWYISAIAIFPEFRSRGAGQALLQKAELVARTAGAEHLSLMVGSFNKAAHRLYTHFGFLEWERRTFAKFPGSDQNGEWILMYTPVLHKFRGS